MTKQEKFIEKARKVHKDKYDYSKVDYKNCKELVTIICPIHGEFEQTPTRHLNSLGCPLCAKESRINKKSLSKEEFVKRASKLFNNKYDYSKVEFKSVNDIGVIICPIHGEFKQKIATHLQGIGCKKCGIEKRSSDKRLTTEEFIEKAKQVHNNYYSYEHSCYSGSHNKITITCPIHGDVEVIAMNHLKGAKCPKCLGRNLTTEEWISKAKEIHGNKYEYDKVDYIDNRTPITITCPIHGDFNQTPNSHLNGRGCPKCGREKAKESNLKNTSEFIQESIQVHGDKYNYSLVNYTGKDRKVKIICPIHGEFEQRPNDHLRGCGCPKCNESKGEKLINNYLKILKLNYTRQFPVQLENRLIYVDFKVEYNNKIYFIEYNGQQHYKSTEYFGGDTALELQQYRDSLLYTYCVHNNIEFIEIPYIYTDEMIINKLKTTFNEG